MKGNQLTDKRTFPQLLLRLLFVALPTLAITWYILDAINDSYSALNTGVEKQVMWFGIGLAGAYILYFFRVRFIVTFILLCLAYWLVDRWIGNMDAEFDVFKTMVKFELYSTLFLIGWVVGFLLTSTVNFFGMRIAFSKYSPIVISGIYIVITVMLASDTWDVSRTYVLMKLLPVLAYALYMLFIAHPLAETLHFDARKTGRILLRMLILVLFIGGVLVLSHYFNRDELQSVQKLLDAQSQNQDTTHGGGTYDEQNGLLKQDKGNQKHNGGQDDKGFRLKDTMKMSDKMSQSDFVMFCSRLNNYFPDGTPKPLYFVYHYLTKYDPKSESFVRDTLMPFRDELDVDPSALGMYKMKRDSSVIKNSLATKDRKVVDAEVYISANTWRHGLLGPAGTFSCQAIPIDSSFKKMFIEAYKVKAYVSDLNNAYFVYNPSSNPMIARIQEDRFAELRTVKDYSKTDTALYRYYTQMPKGTLYDSIRQLALRITKNATTPVDKIIAVRDYFMQKDKNGIPVFRYTLHPGKATDPNIPNASMLDNFLFHTHAGYCTYFAGASMFLLRCAGIPARFTTGFATIDRSDKNKGWYWFYASQAHAWTQAYFPGYGWLDFDMTIGNTEQREAPRPDATPPLPPPQPWLVLVGTADDAPNLKSKRLDVTFDQLTFFNDDYTLSRKFTRTIDASVCRVMYDKKDTSLSAIHAGDSLVVVSYDDASKIVPQPRKGVDIETQLKAWPSPIAADEIHIKPKPEPEKKQKDQKKLQQQKAKNTPVSWKHILLVLGIVAASLIVLLVFTPLLWLLFLIARMNFSRTTKTKADNVYRLALYHFHMTAAERGDETPLEYGTAKIDPVYRSGFAGFMQVYLRLKYGSGEVLPGDENSIRNFGKNIRSSIRKQKGIFKAFFSYFNLARANRFFRRPTDNFN